MISVIHLDRLDYSTGLGLQERLVSLRKDDRIGDTLLLLEHSPVITLGRNAKAENVIASPEILAERGVEMFETNRGGDVTFHGPGQLVGYPIFNLRGFSSPNPRRGSLGAVDFVRYLEEVLIRTCANLEISARRLPGLTGVWTDPDRGAPLTAVPTSLEDDRRNVRADEVVDAEAKIAAIGIHISRSVTSHGFALNINIDLDWFKLIVPCGIQSKPVTSMARELNREVSTQQVTDSIVANFGAVFEREMVWVQSVDALLGETVGVPMKLPEQFRRIDGEKDIFFG